MADRSPTAMASQRGGQNLRGGRRREDPASNQPQLSDANHRGRGFRGVRGERRGQKRGRGDLNHNSVLPDTHIGIWNGRRLDQAPNRGGLDSDLDAERINQGQIDQRAIIDQKKPEEEGEVCFICASTIDHLSIAPCNHQTCHICALRLRALYKKRDCAYCKTEATYVIFTDDAGKKYEDFAEADFVRSDENLGIRYVNDVVLEDTILLLRYNCPDRDCDVACLGWPHLHRHVKQKHGKLMCDLCTRNKKVFTHEHELFTYGDLRRHEKFGDDHPGAIDQSGFKGHPECGFCRERFYGDDELYQHCREKHERCHICDRRNPGSKVQYYLDYQALEKHFEEAHFVCLDAECQANKTNVFESEMDLKAHQLSAHPNGLSKDARRDARLVNISSFDYRTPYQPPRRGDRGHRGNGRGRDPNAEALPVSSAQPLRRDELAYQRQMAIVNSQPQLVARNHAASPVPTSNTRPTPSTSQLPDLDTLAIDVFSTPNPDQNQSAQEEARRIRHMSVLGRASRYLNADSAKLSTFRAHVSSYRTSTIDATELIDSLSSLFDVPSAELGKLVRELADIYEDDRKRQDLLKAWNDWLSIHGDGDARPGGRRVLRLKSSTAQSSRSAVSRQGSWGNVLGTGSFSSASNPFPALGGASSLSNGQKRAAWTPLPSSSTRASPAPSRPSSRPPPQTTTTTPTKTLNIDADEEMFPVLPTARKPDTLMAGLTRGAVRWDDGRSGRAPAANPWGTLAKGPRNPDAEADSMAEAGADSADAGAGAGAATGKKAKKGKQVLYKFG